MPNHQLTHKQEKFILAVVEGMTQADAYRHAYNTEKMTPKSIHEKASVLMSDVKVKARYDELMSKVRTRLEEKAIVTVEDVLQSILKIRDACMQPIPVTDKSGKKLGETILDSNGALKANEMLGKTLKMFTDKTEISGELKMPDIKLVK